VFYAFCRVFWALGKLRESGSAMLKEKLVVKLAASPVSSSHSGTGYLYHTRPVLLLIDSERRFVVSSIPLLLKNSAYGTRCRDCRGHQQLSCWSCSWMKPMTMKVRAGIARRSSRRGTWKRENISGLMSSRKPSLDLSKKTMPLVWCTARSSPFGLDVYTYMAGSSAFCLLSIDCLAWGDRDFESRDELVKVVVYGSYRVIPRILRVIN